MKLTKSTLKQLIEEELSKSDKKRKEKLEKELKQLKHK